MLYCIEVYNLNVCDLSDINVCVTAVYRKIFGYNKWESVKQCIYFLGRLDVFHIYKLRKIQYFSTIQNSVCQVLGDLFNVGLLRSHREYYSALKIGDSTVNLGMSLHSIRQQVYKNFSTLITLSIS